MSTPALPERRNAAATSNSAQTNHQLTEDDILAEPPPAYEATPAENERPVEYGPTRPFQPAHIQPPPLPNRQSGHSPSPSVGSSDVGSGVFSPFAPLQPLPSQHRPPLDWEYEGYHRPQPQMQYSNSYPQQTQNFHSPPPQHPNSFSPPPQQPQPERWNPTESPKHGQPLLRQGKILTFPSNHSECSKCHDTGYKSYDPSSPCTKCWSKFGKPFSGALKIALQSAASDLPPGSVPPNTQRPLPTYKAPARQQPQQTFAPVPGPQTYYANQYYQQQPSYHQNYPQHYQQNWYPPPMQVQRPLYLRPGDPRIGGELCMTCGGDGLVSTGFLGLDEETCYVCRGTGRWLGR